MFRAVIFQPGWKVWTDALKDLRQKSMDKIFTKQMRSTKGMPWQDKLELEVERAKIFDFVIEKIPKTLLSREKSLMDELTLLSDELKQIKGEISHARPNRD